MQDSERQVHRMKNKSYLIIDLKSFYASCECVMRGLDPMTTDLVVADAERGRGTICLAVSPSLKAKGVRFNTDEIIVDHGWGTHGARYILFPGPDGETIEIAEEMQ